MYLEGPRNADLMFLNPDWIQCHWGDLGGGTGNLGKRLERSDQDETWWEE